MPKTAMGSVWRLWDFHAHTPASYLWSGKKLRGTSGAEREQLVKDTIEAMRNAEPHVFVVMDYWSFDGYRAIRNYLAQHPDALGEKQVFPGIELRVESSLNSTRLNVHLVLDPVVEDQVFDDVLAELKIDLRTGERGISDQCFIQYARELGVDKLAKHSFDPTRVQSDHEFALHVGWQTAEIKPASLKRVLDNTLPGKGLMLLPWDTYGGLKDIDFAQHYAEVRRMMRAADIFECKDVGCRSAFHGQRCAENDKYFDNFWAAIDKTARLCVRGTDAHSFEKYGHFPNGMKTWIKAEPTYKGLLQAIREPFFRSFIGEIPQKQALVDANGRLFMSRLQVAKRPGSTVQEKWFDGVDIQLNPDLVAIIGNKGSGKSGLAEVLALAGNSKSKSFFTFLNDKRFLSGSVPRASAFEASLTWKNGDTHKVMLASDPRQDEPERVKYISQFYFEDLCNEHVTGKSDRFGAEIRKVLFTNMDAAERLDFPTLDDYLAAKEQPAADRIADIRERLEEVNQEIFEIERHASVSYANDLKDKLANKELVLKDIEAKRPVEVKAPPSISTEPQNLTPGQERLVAIGNELDLLAAGVSDNEAARRRLTERRNALIRVTERLNLFSQQTTSLNSELEVVLAQVGIRVSPVIEFSLKLQELTKVQQDEQQQSDQLEGALKGIQTKQAAFIAERSLLQEALDAPNKAYQEYLVAQKSWEASRDSIIGASDVTDTIEYYKAQLRALDDIPRKRDTLEVQQEEALRAIHEELIGIAESRKELFEPVDRVVEQFPSIKEDLKVAFQSSLFFDKQAFGEEFFSLVKQNTGGFRGEEEGRSLLVDLMRRTDFSSADSVVAFVKGVQTTLFSTNGGALQAQQVLRSGKLSNQLYALLFDLKYLEAKFSLSLAGTTIQQMSPGQRGALLLIFYLLVDSDQSPLILDQPEENLDNQTVYSMLVPIIQRAKSRRQIVMVTHNANLAVCCDAEQIIHAEFDRADQFALSYLAGAIEDVEMNSVVVDVLEGTQPAFGNRRSKYIDVGARPS
jgi:ABC-type lipoprotein export system ATPase subunit